MMYRNLVYLFFLSLFTLTQSSIKAQEFPIAVGIDSTFTTSAAFDGTNYLIGILGDAVSSGSITAQLIIL